ncbi:MAG: hypothetical protein J5522_06625 [Lachnospiraceae bacterium]|nr:hypothetical protein [Lachnospiraceae bacterium]
MTYLLYFETPIAYTCGIYGWNGDVYTFDGGFTIHTGDRQLAGKKLYLVNEYNNAARKIVENNLLTFQEKRHLVRCLLQRFKVAQYSIYAADKNNVDKLISVYSVVTPAIEEI